MSIFGLLVNPQPLPRHRRTDNTPQTAPARTTRPARPDNIVHLAGRAWTRTEEHPDESKTIYVLDAANTSTAALSPDMDNHDYRQIEVHNQRESAKLKEDTYAALKHVWATGIGYRAAADDHRVKNMSHVGERTRAKYWAAMNQAQRLR